MADALLDDKTVERVVYRFLNYGVVVPVNAPESAVQEACIRQALTMERGGNTPDTESVALPLFRFVVEVEAATQNAAQEQLEGDNRTVQYWPWGLTPYDRTVRSYSGPPSLRDEY